jgi:hypothetical protein
MAHHAKCEAAPAGQRLVLGDGRAGRIDIGPGFPAVEIVPVAMMAAMLAAPLGVGGEGEQAAELTEQVVQPARTEKRAVAAIVLNDEDANEQARGRNSERGGQPIGNMQRPVHRGAGEKEQPDRGRDLICAFEEAGRFVRHHERTQRRLPNGGGLRFDDRIGHCRLASGALVRPPFQPSIVCRRRG